MRRTSSLQTRKNTNKCESTANQPATPANLTAWCTQHSGLTGVSKGRSCQAKSSFWPTPLASTCCTTLFKCFILCFLHAMSQSCVCQERTQLSFHYILYFWNKTPPWWRSSCSGAVVKQQNKHFVLIYTKVFGVNVTFSLTPWCAPPWSAWPVAPCWASCTVVTSVSMSFSQSTARQGQWHLGLWSHDGDSTDQTEIKQRKKGKTKQNNDNNLSEKRKMNEVRAHTHTPSLFI